MTNDLISHAHLTNPPLKTLTEGHLELGSWVDDHVVVPGGGAKPGEGLEGPCLFPHTLPCSSPASGCSES